MKHQAQDILVEQCIEDTRRTEMSKKFLVLLVVDLHCLSRLCSGLLDGR